MRNLLRRRNKAVAQVAQPLPKTAPNLTMATLPDADTPVVFLGDVIGVDLYAVVAVHECGSTPYALIKPFDKRHNAWQESKTIPLDRLELA